MADDLIIQGASKEEIYSSIYPQIEALIAHEPNLMANLANVSAVLKQAFNFFWVGFYLVVQDELVLGPFQGPVACTRIKKGKGVCGTAWKSGQIQLVPDVNTFPGHIACNSASKSEIVVPIRRNDQILAVLDVDSDKINDFDRVDTEALNKIAQLIAQKF
jgi:GAF domain-containing protein